MSKKSESFELTKDTYILVYNTLSDDVRAKQKTRDAMLKDWMLTYPRDGQEFDTPEFRHACKTLHEAANNYSRAVEAFDEIEAYGEVLGF